jgi:Tol biopolymer transport system component
VTVRRLTDQVGLEEAPALSPDGRAIAFVAIANGHRQVRVRLIDSGAEVALTSDDIDQFAPRWAPDSAALIYYTPGRTPGDAGTIWETPALPGPSRRLVEAIAPGDLSRDGSQIAFIRFREGAPQLMVALRDGSSERMISRLPPGAYSNLRLSPDGRRALYIHELGGSNFGTEVMVSDLAGGDPHLVTGDDNAQGAAWLRDGSRLVISSSRGSVSQYPPTYNLWEVSLDGARRTQLTFGESAYTFPDVGWQGGIVVSRIRSQADVWKLPTTLSPQENVQQAVRITRQTGAVQTVTVSPDESDVAFLSDSGGHANVWVARVADGTMRPLTREFDPKVIVAVPYWSPRGDWINYLSNRNSSTGGVTLWVTRPDGSQARDLGIAGAWVCWSSDGEWMYFSAVGSGQAQVIQKVRVDGGTPVTVRSDNAIGCAVAPDNSALYYASILRQAGGGWDLEVRAARPETGPSTVIGRVAASRVPATAVNFQIYPSPDGRWLAAPLLDGSTTNIWTLAIATGEWRRLTDFGARNVVIARRIAWSRDGRHLYASVADVDADIVMLDGLR